MKIILIGFMSSGKTFFAKHLSDCLNLENVRMDEMVQKRSKRQSIKEIFDKDGEIVFRKLEIETAESLQNKTNVVIDTGGGVVENKINLDYLKKDGMVIFLYSPLEVIEKRMSNNVDRPLWQDKKRFGRLYHLRLPLYHFFADEVVNTGEINFFSPDEESYKMNSGARKILEDILEKVNNYKKKMTYDNRRN